MNSKSLFVVFICSLYTVAEMFDLPSSVAHSSISKMTINEELQVCDVCFLTVMSCSRIQCNRHSDWLIIGHYCPVIPTSQSP